MVSVLAPRHRSGSGLLWDGEKRRPFQSCHRSFGRNSLLTSTFQSRPLSHLQQRATISFRSSLSIIAAMPWVEASETSAVASRLSHYLAQHDLDIRQPATRKHRHVPSPCSELQTPRRKGPCLLCLPHILHPYYKDGSKEAAVYSDSWVRQAPTLQLLLSWAQGPGLEI